MGSRDRPELQPVPSALGTLLHPSPAFPEPLSQRHGLGPDSESFLFISLLQDFAELTRVSCSEAPEESYSRSLDHPLSSHGFHCHRRKTVDSGHGARLSGRHGRASQTCVESWGSEGHSEGEGWATCVGSTAGGPPRGSGIGDEKWHTAGREAQ